MKISVIIPTYQPGDYFYHCLDSLKNQDFPYHNFEVIIVLNGPRDPYENKILDYISSKMTNISVNFIYSNVSGVSNARNIGIENAMGEYVFFIDDDDLISTNYLKELYNYKTDDGMVVSNIKTFTHDTSDLSDDYLTKAYTSNISTKFHSFFKLRSFFTTCWAKLIPKQLILDSRFDTDIPISEDSLFMFLLASKMKTINLCPNSEALYYRRVRSHSVNRKKRPWSFRINLSRKLLTRYTILYVKQISNYDFAFYLSRIAGSILTVFKPT